MISEKAAIFSSLFGLQANIILIPIDSPISRIMLAPIGPDVPFAQPDRAQRIKWHSEGIAALPPTSRKVTFRTAWACLWLADIQQLQGMLSYLPVKIEDFLSRLEQVEARNIVAKCKLVYYKCLRNDANIALQRLRLIEIHIRRPHGLRQLFRKVIGMSAVHAQSHFSLLT